uniref:RNA-directed DNA polymerase n=1 Tax=Fagus sylvatica TaxID=28930 RepID=A0A2N9F0R4_FAGSY
MERIKEDFEEFCEKKKEELGKLTPATPPEMSKPDPVVIQYATKEKVMLQTASVSTVQSSEKVPSVVIQVPQPFPYHDNKRVPWNYGMKVISTREGKPKMEEEVVGNLTSGLGGITRSGRCYTPEELEKRRKEIGKSAEDPAKTKVAEDEAAGFLEDNQEKALLKVLNEAYVPEDITGPSFENMTNDRIVSRVLIDNGSALNVCPLSTLEKLDIDPTRVRVTSMIVRAFDGTRREVLGEIDLPVEVGLQVYNINFQVLKIDSPYNLLLGRPWLHTAGAVPSSLHQKMKLIIGNQLVTILAEEPISIYNDGEIPYIDGCASEEASFHSFEFVTVIHRVAAVEPRLSRAGIMVAKEFVKAGFQPGQGLGCANQGRTAIVTLEGNKDRYGLGYTPTRKDRQIAYEARRQRAAAKLRGEKWPEKKMVIPHIRTTFPASAMFQVDEGDVDELALLFAEDLNVNAITTEGDSTAFPIHPDQYEEVDLEGLLDEEDLKGYRIEEETFDEDLGEDANLPNLLPHLMTSRGLETLEFEMFCEHEDPESHLQRYRKKMALYMDNEILMISMFHESFTGVCSHLVLSVEEYYLLGGFGKSFPRPIPPQPQDTTTKQYHHHPLLKKNMLAPWLKEPREVKIGTRCTTEQKEALIALLREFHEIFAWSYQDMPGLDTDIVVHKIPLKPECKPVKQALRRMKPEVILKIKEEVEKQLKAGFLSTVNLFGLGSQHSPGAEERMEKLESTNAVFSFMDGFSGYNQIKMAEEDKSKTAFVTHWGTFVYDVMPFGLKNAGATLSASHDLRKLFQRLKKYQLRLNPNKCAFGVTSGKLLGFIVSGRGIEIDPAKVQAIRSMPAPKTEKEIRSFLGRINYIARFIAQLTATCEPLFKLLRKDSKKHPWAACLGQQDETGTGKKEQAIYYLSKKFTEPETRYLVRLRRRAAHLAWASKKLRQYMLYYTTWLRSRDKAIADYLADYPSEQLELMDSEFPDEDVMTVDEDNHGRWKLYFDGAANAVGSGIGAVLVSPKGQQTPIAVKLGFDCTNNMTEYEACIVGLQAALEFGAYELEVFGDFSADTHNHFADALATLASLIKLVEGDDVRPLRIETRDIPAYCVCVEECMNVEAEIDNKPWYYDIKRFIQDREYPPRATENEKKYIRRMAFQFFLKRRDSPMPTDPSWLRKIMRAGYYLVDNGEGLHQTCPDVPQMPDVSELQERTSPVSPHYGLAVALLSLGNGCDWCNYPKGASNGHEFILVAIDYFTKWVEACSFKNVTQVAVTRFVKNNIICRYGMPEMLITDNASNLNNRMMDQLCQQFKIQHHNSAPYRPKMNGAVEAANKNVKKILSKMTETYKDWHEHLPYAFVCLPNISEDIRWSHSLLSGIRDGSSTASRSGDPFFENPVTNSAGRSRMGPSTSLQQESSLERAYNKKARPRTFQPGDLVLKKRNMALSDPRGKFAPSYEGPYVVKKAFSGRSNHSRLIWMVKSSGHLSILIL